MFAVDMQFDPSLPDETSPESRPVKRLPIFESFTEANREQPDDLPVSPEDEYSIPDSGDEETVNVALSRLLADFEVPESPDLIVFRSLLKMFENPKDSSALPSWQQYVEKAIRNQDCLVMNLCSEYNQHFKCEEGHLTFINVDGMGSFDHLNLLMIPNTVRVFSAERCKLKTISPWSDLKGKSLECLRLKDNADLNLDLHGLTGDSDHLLLSRLAISKVSILKYFGLRAQDRTDLLSSGITEWMKQSTLECMKVLQRGHRGGAQKKFIILTPRWNLDARNIEPLIYIHSSYNDT